MVFAATCSTPKWVDEIKRVAGRRVEPIALERWTAFWIAVSSIGVGDSIYLTINSLFPRVPLECPTQGVINCGLVTTSKYSHIFGIPVALLGLLWFGSMLALALIRPSFSSYLLFPLWVAGIAMIGYLVSAELLILHAICLYCTLAHICALSLGLPVYLQTFRE